jgi:hypothetical protein
MTISLGGCVTSSENLNPATELHADPLPPIPADLQACLTRQFPAIPARALTRDDVFKIIVDAKRLDKAKTACGVRAIDWMKAVIESRSIK